MKHRNGTPPEEERSEKERLEALHRYASFDPQKTFDRITRLAAETFGVPITQINLVGATQQWTKACYGFEASSPLPRADAFCHYTIQTPGPLVVEDAQQDARFAGTPLVEDAPHIRFYAGTALRTPGGHQIGTLCLIDREPRAMSETELDRLGDLAALAMEGLELRRRHAVQHDARAEETKEKEFAQSLIEGLPGIFYLFDRDGRMKQWNRLFEKATGYTSDEIQQMHPLDFVAESDRPYVTEAIERAFDEGQAAVEADLLSREGIAAPHLIHAKRLFIGGAPHLVGTAADITERKAAETARHASEARFRALVEHGSDVIAILEKDGTVRYQSPSVERVMGRSAGTLYGENIFDHVHPDDRARLQTAFAQCLEQPGAPVSTQYRMKHADGAWVHLESVGRNLLDDPDVEGIVVNSRDITERQEARDALSRRLELEKMVARVSEKLLAETADLDAVVALLGEAVGAEHAYLSRVDEEHRVLTSEHQWHAPGLAPAVAEGRALSLDDFSWWREAIRGRESLSIVVDELPPEAASEQRFYREHGLASVLDVPIRFSDGTLFGFIGYSAGTARTWAAEDVRLLRMVSNLLAGYFERTRSEDALRESEQQFRDIAETITQAFWVVTPEQDELLYVSPAFAEIWGCLPEALDAYPAAWEETIHPDDRARVLAARDEARPADPYDVEFRIVRPDGEVRWVHDRAFPSFDENGDAEHIIGVTEDVTERRERAEALRRSERKFRNVIESARDVIFQTDAEGRWTFLSPSWEKATGYSVEESLGTHFTDYLAQEESVDAFRERVVDENDVAAELVRYRTKAGEIRWFRISSRVLRSEDGAILGGTGTLTDATDSVRFESEREARLRAEELLETKTSFLNAMSHELRTPLASILGFADVLVEEGTGQQREFAEHIAASGKRLRQTLESVLRLAQLDGGGVELELHALDLGEAVRDMTGLLEVTARENALTFEVEAPEHAVYSTLDEATLHRILDNLVGNAIKFTDEGGITIRVEDGTETARIHVEDTGIGIGEAFLPRLFEDFAQESAGLSRSHEGSGLGLAITRRLVELMDGSIAVESEKGVGTRFTVSFPRRPLPPGEASPQEDAQDGSAPVPGPATLPVLLVEDNPNMQHLARHILDVHYDLTVACAFDEAVALAEEHAGPPFGLLLLDIDLGESASRSGTHLLQRLRETHACADAPAVALTAYAMPDDRERFLQAGFDEYLPKPFTKEDLLDCAARLTSAQPPRALADHEAA